MPAAPIQVHSKSTERGVIIMTDRTRPIADSVPLPTDQVVEQGVAEGWITPPSVAAPMRSTARHTSTRSIAEVLNEDRGA